MLNWEKIENDNNEHLYRAKVFGGWLVMATSEVMTQVPDIYGQIASWRNEQGYQWRSSICFIPDVKHEWLI